MARHGPVLLGVDPDRGPIELAHFVVRERVGTVPGPASQIGYRMNITLADGVVQEETVIVPGHQRYPDELDIRGADPGTNGIGLMIGGQFEPTVIEIPDFGLCPESGGNELAGLLLRIAELEHRLARAGIP